jgi:hypothetical protein
VALRESFETFVVLFLSGELAIAQRNVSSASGLAFQPPRANVKAAVD